jgi:DNA modification methylase
MRQLVLDFTDPDDVILDPFAGSGSTGRAAVTEGRRAVLVERDEVWCAEAASRFGASVPQRGGQAGLAW